MDLCILYGKITHCCECATIRFSIVPDIIEYVFIAPFFFTFWRDKCDFSVTFNVIICALSKLINK